MAKSYLIGIINILAGISLAAVLGVLLIFQITHYQYTVSFKPSLSFFLFDLFGTKLFILITIAMLTNFFSAVVMFSGLFSNKGFTLSFIFSLLTLLWIVLFLGISFAFTIPIVSVVPLVVGTVIMILIHQLKKAKYIIPAVLLTLLIALVSFI